MPVFSLTSEFHCGVVWTRYHPGTGHFPPSGTTPGQSRQAIIFRLAALFLSGSNGLTFRRDYDGENTFFEGA
jgi:hypothetical protein